MVTSFALTDCNRVKLKTIADELGVKPNRALNLLIANASIGEVVKREPVVTLVAQKNSGNGVTTTKAAESVRS